MKAFPSVEDLTLPQAMQLLQEAMDREAEEARPHDPANGHYHDNMKYRMLKFATRSLRSAIEKKFDIDLSKLDAPAAPAPGV